MEPLVSVIVPVYNVEKYLDRCVESIVNQTYRNLEIILVDDGSPDNCPQMCDDWAKKDERIKVLHKSNGGVSSARNFGINESSGEYISFIDSDDYIRNDMLEIIIKVADKYNADMVRCSYNIDTYGKDEIVVAEVDDEIRIIKNREQFLNDLHWDGHKAAFIANKVFKRSSIGEIRFNENFVAGEDVLFVYSVLERSNIVVYYDIPLYFYYVHDEQCNSRTDFNYEVFKTFDYLTDQKPAILMYYKFFVFCCMAIRDSVNNDDDKFYEVRKQVIMKKHFIKNAIRIKKDKKNLLKLYAICYFPSLYSFLIKRGF